MSVTIIGKNIKRIRKEKGLTQKQLGDLCGLADSAIRRYELGSVTPKVETLEKIATALKCDFLDLTLEREKKEQIDKGLAISNGFINILRNIYDEVEIKTIDIEYTKDEFIQDYYYLIHDNESKFVLYAEDISKLIDYVKHSIPFIIDTLKDTRSEDEIINEFTQKMKYKYEQILKNRAPKN